jgi:hypothetical protein
MTLKHTPATALPWWPRINTDGQAVCSARGENGGLAFPFEAAYSDKPGVLTRGAQDIKYAIHAGCHYPLMVGALRSSSLVPEFIDRMDAETLRKFIREQAGVAAETLVAIGEAE